MSAYRPFACLGLHADETGRLGQEPPPLPGRRSVDVLDAETGSRVMRPGPAAMMASSRPACRRRRLSGPPLGQLIWHAAEETPGQGLCGCPPAGPGWRSVTLQALCQWAGAARLPAFGAHLVTRGDVGGVRFADLGTTARRVGVVGSFNNWDVPPPLPPPPHAPGCGDLHPHVSVGDLYRITRSLRPTASYRPSRPTLCLCRRDAAQHGSSQISATYHAEPCLRSRPR